MLFCAAERDLMFKFLGAILLSDMASHSGNRSGHRASETSQRDTRSPNSQPGSSASPAATAAGLPTAKNRALLAEAVDSVVNTFAKHARGYGRGRFLYLPIYPFIGRNVNSILWSCTIGGLLVTCCCLFI